MPDLACLRPTNTADLRWNLVSNLEPSGSEAETLPLGYRGLTENCNTKENCNLRVCMYVCEGKAMGMFSPRISGILTECGTLLCLTS
ncbi:hypothetical protein AVEN_154551-1 [Araneus ventricosus]|uniref:Uncharacterized protein n=2 Tax=Araneus ventricosus TaxID=182803 RepID=A0A4Y2ICL4_ARAVE|nr:hypothetical protein AVEN_17253-1 [Araneus ventricosus]GBM75290.1 hypothetical protein AVEN_154551-1 [Araneus ventricosus]